MDIDQFRREVRVGSVGGNPQPRRDLPGDFEFTVERRRRFGSRRRHASQARPEPIAPPTGRRRIARGSIA